GCLRRWRSPWSLGGAGRPAPRSGEQFGNRAPALDECAGFAVRPRQALARIDAETLVDRGEEIGERDGPIGRGSGVGITGAGDPPALDAAARGHDAPDAPPGGAAPGGRDPGRAGAL